jgi:uncharacterized damage-inducible protein DinB
MLSHLRDLAAHAEWANAVFFHTWDKSPARDHEELRRRVGHVLDVQDAFVGMLKGEVPTRSPEGLMPSFADLTTRARASHARLSDYTALITSEALTGKLRITWFPDPPCEITRFEALVQVAMHTQHHRGQLMTRLKDFGGEPKNVDWIIWLWKQKPQGRWE